MKKAWFIGGIAAVVALAVAAVLLLPPFFRKEGDIPASTPSVKETILLDQILDRDGFLDGVWYPWLFEGKNGRSLTANEMMARYYGKEWTTAAIDEDGIDATYRSIYNLKAMGYNIMGYGGSMYGEGVVYDNNGDVLGIKQDYLDNARRLLDMCREIGMPVMWTVCFHSSALASYMGMDCWPIINRMYSDPTVADHYAQRFVRPLCGMLAEYPDVVALVALADEPENEIHDSETGMSTTGVRAFFGTTQEKMLYFLTAVNEAVKAELPTMPRTIAGNWDNLGQYQSLELTYVGRNRYSDRADVGNIAQYQVCSPMLVTEYNVGDLYNFTEEAYEEAMIAFRSSMIEEGYRGGFLWTWMIPCENANGYFMKLTPVTSETDFRSSVYTMYHVMQDSRAAHRGETVALDIPALFYHDGSGLVEWIAPRQNCRLDLLRSDDGGDTWIKVLDAVAATDYADADGKGSYTDTAVTADSIYRVTVRDEAGHEASSAVSNKVGADRAHLRDVVAQEIPYDLLAADPSPMLTKEQATLTSFGVFNDRPVSPEDNLIVNGSFESADDGQWNGDTFLSDAVYVTEDSTAPDGSKTLCFDTTKQAEAAWYTFSVAVEPDTDYVFSVWIKGAYVNESNRAQGSIGVVDPATGGFMVFWDEYRRASCHTKQIYPPAWDEAWHLRSVAFNSADQTEVTVAVYGTGALMWMDDMALFRQEDGKRYISETLSAMVKLSYDCDYIRCEPSVSVTENLRLDDAASDYWQTGYGWDNGFMSVVSHDYGFGTSLKYSGGEQSAGVYYVKWIDVQPHTRYVFSMDYKVLQDGDGCVSLWDDGAEGFTAFLTVDVVRNEFMEGENGWCTAAVVLDTDICTRIGFAVCDGGGEVLLDNIRLFRVEDGSDVTDP